MLLAASITPNASWSLVARIAVGRGSNASSASAGYFGFLVGPPSIGFVAEALGLGGALYTVVALSAVIVFLAGAVGRGSKKG